MADGSIVGYGDLDNAGLVVKLDSMGVKVWENTYANSVGDWKSIRCVSELNNSLYMLSEGGAGTCTGSIDIHVCQSLGPSLETIDREDGLITNSVKIDSLNGATWDGVSSFRTTSDGQFLIGTSVRGFSCAGGYGCDGAAIVTINTQGGIDWEWVSLGVASHYNGRYAAERPTGGYVLTGQREMGLDGDPIAFLMVIKRT